MEPGRAATEQAWSFSAFWTVPLPHRTKQQPLDHAALRGGLDQVALLAEAALMPHGLAEVAPRSAPPRPVDDGLSKRPGKAGEKVFSPGPSSISLSWYSPRGRSNPWKATAGVWGGNAFSSPTLPDYTGCSGTGTPGGSGTCATFSVIATAT